MVLLPKIVYTFQIIPITIPRALFRTIKTMFLRYIWQGKKPRVQYAILSGDKVHRGLAAPDIKRYYNAVIMTRMIEWTKTKNAKRWKVQNTGLRYT